MQENNLMRWHASTEEQHFEITQILRSLREVQGLTVRSEEVSSALNDLTKLSMKHFHDEEELLAVVSYPRLAEHKAEHKEFRTEIASLCLRATDHDAHVPENLLDFLQVWWREHLEGEDRRADNYIEGLLKEARECH